MAEQQRDLGLFETTETDTNVKWLEKYLRESGGWMTAAVLAAAAGRPITDEGRRWVRMLAEASSWVISGQKGYKHLQNATAEEVSHFVNWMESQGKKMIARAERARRNAHAVMG